MSGSELALVFEHPLRAMHVHQCSLGWVPAPEVVRIPPLHDESCDSGRLEGDHDNRNLDCKASCFADLEHELTEFNLALAATARRRQWTRALALLSAAAP